MKNLSHQNFEHSDLLVSQDWTFPVPIAYGPGRFSEMWFLEYKCIVLENRILSWNIIIYSEKIQMYIYIYS